MARKWVYVIAPGGVRAQGGMGRVVAHLTRRLATDGEFALASLDTYGHRVNETGAALAMPLHFVRALIGLLGACLGRRIGLAHIHMAAYGSVYRKSLLIAICRAFRVPTIVHLHGGNLDRFWGELGGWRRAALRRLFAGVSLVVVLGEYWRDFAVSALAMPHGRVTVLHNAVPRPPEPVRRPAAGPCRLLFLGMVWPEKGMGEMLAALAMPEVAALAWHLTVAGIGDIAGYRAEAERRGIGNRIAFVGWADEGEICALLTRSDILLLPSHFECFPMAVIEAMAYGLAVIVTRVGSVEEAITDGESGLLVPVGDSPALGWAIRRLIEEPDLQRRLGARARARFCEKFDLDILERRVRDLYRTHIAAD